MVLSERETLFVCVYLQSGMGNPCRVAIFENETDAQFFSLRIKRELGITPYVVPAVVNPTIPQPERK